MGGLGNMASMFGSLQQLPDKMKELNDRMKSESVNATSECGLVNVTMSGTGHVEQVSIGDGLSGHELEVAIGEATNAAGAAAKKMYAESIHQLVDEMDLKIPGLEGVIENLTGGG